MLDTLQKLEILADAAKYDVSCSSSGATKAQLRTTAGSAPPPAAGICHSYTPDGRCVSLLKILLTNSCIFDCAYCINRNSSNVQRARFTADEVVDLTLNFYKRNYIEGLFLSSGHHPLARLHDGGNGAGGARLREQHGFHGYIHLKSIPEADPTADRRPGRYADRLSINVELPTEQALKAFAPEKRVSSIRQRWPRCGCGSTKHRPRRTRPGSHRPDRARS